MEHRIVGPGPYRATKLVSERAGQCCWLRDSPTAYWSAFASPRAGQTRVLWRDVFRPGQTFSGRCSKLTMSRAQSITGERCLVPEI